METVTDLGLVIASLLSVNIIVPLTSIIKKYYIKGDWAFLAWGIQVVLSFGAAALGVLLSQDAWSISTVLNTTLVIMGGSSGLHAAAKTYTKIKNGQ